MVTANSSENPSLKLNEHKVVFGYPDKFGSKFSCDGLGHPGAAPRLCDHTLIYVECFPM